ncbi:MAG: TonB-dependent receptor [Deltaproteobacteria bacterium]|jgi:outer membrane receptor protein involved in Fe transport|nr:TonB-dependent receptor [Deltaproteobacteria bacterium]
MSRCFIQLVVFSLMALLAAPVAMAQSSNLSRIIVSDTYGEFSPEGRKTSAHVEIIDSQTIEMSPAQNLTDLLHERGVAGFNQTTPWEASITFLRGNTVNSQDSEANSQLLFLIDGVRSGVVNANQLALDNIDHIEIIRGPQMYKYAASSHGGVVNIITKRGGSKPLEGKAEVQYGSWDTFGAQIVLNGSHKALDYYLTYRHTTMRGDYKDGRQDTVINTSFDAIDSLSLNLGYTLTGAHRLGLSGSWYGLRDARKPLSYTPGTPRAPSRGEVDRETWRYNLTYEGGTEDGNLTWQASLGTSHDEFAMLYYATPNYPYTQSTDTLLAKAGLNYRSELFDIDLGFDYTKYDLENGGPDERTGATIYDGFLLHPTSSTADLGLYLVGTLKLIDQKLNLTGGLRYDRWDVRDKAIGDESFFDYPFTEYYGFVGGQRPTRQSYDSLSPSFGVSYLPTPWLKFRASYTRTFRAPSGRQLFASNITEGYYENGDPRLQPEKADNWEAGFDVSSENISASFTYFRSRMDNNIFPYPVMDPRDIFSANWMYRRMIQNAERRTAGIEFDISVNLAGLLGHTGYELRPYFGLNYLTEHEFKLSSDPSLYTSNWLPIIWVPESSFFYGLRYRHFGFNTEASLNFYHYGRMQWANPGSVITPISYANYQYGKFTVADLTIKQRILDFNDKGHIDLKLNVTNIFDEFYTYNQWQPNQIPYMPGRAFYLSLAYVF